jgi:uncharacterized protein
MSYALFITDLHGNSQALLKALKAAETNCPVRFLIIGGDIAPNVISVSLQEGNYLLDHAENFNLEIAHSFKRRVKENLFYDSAHLFGKIAASYPTNLSRKDILSLTDNELSDLLRYPASFEFLKKQQLDYFHNDLLPHLRRIKQAGIKIFCMLGNDDFAELQNSLQEAEQQGVVSNITNQTKEFGNKFIFGYPYVVSKPFRYRYWEKDEESIYEEINNTLMNQDTEDLILSIHQPPYNTNLDVLHSGLHAGSHSIRKILEEYRFSIGLFGHIHESCQKSGKVYDYISDNLIINPGAYHDSQVSAIVFSVDNPKEWQLVNSV